LTLHLRLCKLNFNKKRFIPVTSKAIFYVYNERFFHTTSATSLLNQSRSDIDFVKNQLNLSYQGKTKAAVKKPLPEL